MNLARFWYLFIWSPTLMPMLERRYCFNAGRMFSRETPNHTFYTLFLGECK